MTPIIARLAAVTTTVAALGVLGTGHVAADPAPKATGLCDDMPGPLSYACSGLNNGIRGAVGDVASSAFDAVVKSLLSGLAKALEWCLDWWLTLPSPQLADSSTGAPGPVLSVVRDYTGDLQILLMTGAIILTGARLALARRGGLVAETQETFVMFARAVLASWMFAALIAVGTRFGDAFSSWVITDATHNDAVGAVKNMLNTDKLIGDSGLGTGAMFLIAIIGLIGALLQLVLLVIRQALLIVVVALIPVAAAAAGTGPGSQAYKRLVTWSLAFVLYKPVGALVYVVAFSAGSRPDSDPQQTLLGLILLALVAIVMPAIIRLVAPAVATMGGGGMGMVAAGLVGAGLGRALGSSGGRGDSGGDNAGGRTVDERPAGGNSGSGSGNGGGSRGGGGGGGGNGGSGGGRRTQGTESDGGGQQQQARQASTTGGTQNVAAQSGTQTTTAGSAGGPIGLAAVAAIETGKRLYGATNQAVSPDSGHEVPQ